MQLFTRVLLLAATVLSASAWPGSADETSLFRMVMAQLSAPLSEARSLSPAEVACVNRYNNATNKIGEQLANSTGKCEEAFNRTLVTNNQNSNATVNQIRSQLMTLQKNLQLCSNETDNMLLINCTTSHFDKNLHLLDTSNSLAYQTESQFSTNSSIVQNQRSSCVSAAVSESKVKSIEAANDFDSCMAKVPAQRELAAQKEREQDHKQMTQSQPQQNTEQQSEQQSVQQSAQQPAQQPAQQSAQQPAQQSAQQPAPQSVQQPAQPAGN